MKNTGNVAFIDGQNLFLSTKSWGLDFARFRKYLSEKYNVEKAYYFIGVMEDKQQSLYVALQEAGFIVRFRNHSEKSLSKKKGNVDTDIVFYIMKGLYKKELKGKVVLISGDGDYFSMVKFLEDEDLLAKIIFPGKNYSSLYKGIMVKNKANLSDKNIQAKIKARKR